VQYNPVFAFVNLSPFAENNRKTGLFCMFREFLREKRFPIDFGSRIWVKPSFYQLSAVMIL
jgi:hypothetical protein